MKRSMVWILLLLGVALPACRESASGPKFIAGTGTVHQGAAECSAWFVRADSGGEHQITQLPAEFQQNDLRVRFTLHPRNDLVSICMVGDITDVVSMEKL